MRVLVYALAALLAFAAGMLVPLALTGNLNAEGINRILGRAEPAELSAPREDPLGSLARKLRDREEQLRAREQQLEERLARIEQRERELDDTLEQLEEIQARLDERIAEEDAARMQRIEKMADIMAAMEPAKAAEDLESMTPDDAAEVLLLIKDRTAGAILDEMEPRKRVLIHQILQSRGY